MPNLACDPTGTSHPTVGPVKPNKPDDYLEIKDTVVYIEDWFSIVDGIEISQMGDIVGLSLSSFSNGPTEVFTLTENELFDGEGQVIDLSVTLMPGLYVIDYQLDDGTQVPIVVEVNTGSQGFNTLSNYLNVIVFPNPIVENTFSLALSATSDLSYDYIMTDIQGNRLYTDRMEIKTGESAIIQITPENQIPSGIHIHTFIFEDGSVKSLLTVKS